jgi:hypothetical protein
VVVSFMHECIKRVFSMRFSQVVLRDSLLPSFFNVHLYSSSAVRNQCFS